MQIKIQSSDIQTSSQHAILGLFDDLQLTPSGQSLQSHTAVADFLSHADKQGQFAASTTLYLGKRRVVFMGAGESKSFTIHQLRALASKTAQRLSQAGINHADIYLTELEVAGASISEKVQAITEGFLLGLYTFNAYQTKEQPSDITLASINIMVAATNDVKAATTAMEIGQAVANGTNFARDLGNEPGNVCTPEYLGEQALALKHDKLNVTVMDKAAIEKAGFTALLAVNQGSAKEPRFIVLDYKGAGNADAPVALVGKGLTFDAGGISIKPAAGMDEMKFDMCGAAAVLGIFKSIIALHLPINVLGVIPSTENLLGGAAYKPDDIVTSYKGITIEVLNTDAEGRVILSDALAYAVEQKPAEIIDFATLTGACVVALGGQASGLLGTGESVKAGLKASGERTQDRVWELPMFAEYQKQIDSKIADIKNTGGKEAGTITAACFLSRFVGEVPWAHLDIAGTAWNMQGNDISPVGGATGAGVRLVVDYLMHR